MYIVSGIIIAFIAINYFLEYKLYSVPKNEGYFNNVTEFNIEREKYISPQPLYVTMISIFTGIMLGLYVSLCEYFHVNKILMMIVSIAIFVCYFIEITRNISLVDGNLILSKAFSKKIVINATSIKGMYLYSWNKKFLKKHALTTKLVITTNSDKKYKFVISSLDNKAVLNLLKENFGVINNKMYIGKKTNKA